MLCWNLENCENSISSMHFEIVDQQLLTFIIELQLNYYGAQYCRVKVMKKKNNNISSTQVLMN